MSRLCQKRTGLGHFLSHSSDIPENHLHSTQLSIFHIALAFGYYTPYIERHQRWTMVSVPGFLSALNALRWGIWRDRNLLHGIYHSTMLVSPTTWAEKGGGEAFGLENPPEPYEVACAILLEPAPNFWAFHVGATNQDHCNISALKWWLMGFPEPALAKNLGISDGKLCQMLDNAVKYMMTKPKFAIWALGSSLIPACTNRVSIQVATAYALGTPLPKKGNYTAKRAKVAQQRLFDHPYIKTQLKTGRRTGPLCRPLYSPGIVWKSKEEKGRWEKEENPGTTKIKEVRKKISNHPHQHPDWLELTNSD